jgi:hypothetical protein
MGAPGDPAVPPDMERALQELCVLRDVLSHRGRRIDEKAAREWPSGDLALGSFVRVTSDQARLYSAAVGAYGQEVIRRLLAKTGLPTTPQLDNWFTYRFLV